MTLTTVIATLLLMAALGVRHGVDPEHIAIVNSVTMQAVEHKRRWPAASGVWFALGHGLVITLVALAVVELLGALALPHWIIEVGNWIPLVILFFVAFVNLRELLRDRADYRPVAVKQRFLPQALGDTSSPLAVFCIGMLFAPFVDPATQLAVWGYAVTVAGSVLWILALGALLTMAMAVTCLLEARAVVYLTHAVGRRAAARRRRIIGWLIVAFSFAVIGYGIADTAAPATWWWPWRFASGLLLGATIGMCTGLTVMYAAPAQWLRRLPGR